MSLSFIIEMSIIVIIVMSIGNCLKQMSHATVNSQYIESIYAYMQYLHQYIESKYTYKQYLQRNIYNIDSNLSVHRIYKINTVRCH